VTSALAIAALGFFLGMRHATDADHVIAVTTIVSRHRSVRTAAWIGALWGLGHTLTILVVGGTIILFGWVIPPRVGLSMELSVGLMLVALGIMNLTGTWQGIQGALGLTQLVRPLVVGIVHGLAGSAAVALLVLAALQSTSWSLLYLLVFGLGTIAGMMLFTAGISIPFALSGTQFTRLHRGLRIASGALSLGFGLFLAYQVGVVHGLFTGQV
jgi:high-affinity nickel-transport protein